MTRILAELNIKCPFCKAPIGYPCGNESHPERHHEWARLSEGHGHKKPKHHDREEVKILREIEEDEDEQTILLREIRDELKPHLRQIKIRFGGNMPVGPAVITVGQTTPASVLGFDQNGAAIAIDFTANPVSWSIDNSTIASSTPNPDSTDTVVGVSAGVANLTASCAGFTDTETVTVTAVVPVLSSIKISFA